MFEGGEIKRGSPFITASEAEQRFRDLFGVEELDDARRLYFACNIKTPYPVFLEQETERKLREQDGD